MARSALILVAAACLCQAQPPSPWRVWTNADGLSQSFTSSLTTDPQGRILARHGASFTFSTLDGYQVSNAPDSHAYGRLRADEAGELWTFDSEGILIRDGPEWHKYPDPEVAEYAKASHLLVTAPYLYDSRWEPQPATRMEVMPEGHNKALLLLPDRLFEWDRATRQKHVIRIASETVLTQFRDIRRASGKGFWIAGDHGLAHLEKDETRGSTEYSWKEYRAPEGMSNLISPSKGQGQELFLAVRRPSGNGSIVRFEDGAWSEVFAGGPEPMRGWRDDDGTIWVQDGDHILRQDGKQFHEAGLDSMAGEHVTYAMSTGNDSFWIATRDGLARYSPPLWRTPPEVEWVKTMVDAMVEDKQGRIWFLSEKYLIVNDHGTWGRFPLPAERTEETGPGGLFPLDDGELVVGLDRKIHVMVFNPANGTFRTVVHPGGAQLGLILKRPAGDAWAQVYEHDDIHWRMEIFDGSGFRQDPESPVLDLKFPRAYAEAKNGDLWVGGTTGLGVYRNGNFRLLGPKDGFEEPGVFSAVKTPARNLLFAGLSSVIQWNGETLQAMAPGYRSRSMAVGNDGWTWIASSSGMLRVRAGQTVINTKEDGLPASAAVSVLVDSQERVWAGTDEGISLFHPEADIDPPTTIVQVDQNSRETPPGGEAHLVFSGMDKWKYTAADRLTFSWRMDGAAWSEFSSSRLASFKGLNAGGHQFEVRAMDRNGNVDPSPARFRFTVLLPWYRQMGFMITAALALLIIFSLLRLAWLHHRKLAYQSGHDPLTRLANRAVFEPEIQRAIGDARRDGRSVAMILLDLDRFKVINDTLGHNVGDHFLREVSRRLEKCVRKVDTLARMGGDEFAVVMPGLESRQEAEFVAERILHALRQPYQIDSYELSSSASIGVSLFPEHGEDGATLQRLADMAMYQCKARNKDQYAVFDPHVNRIDFRTAHMAGLILEALEHEYFQLEYLPYQTIEGELLGLEALVRFRHPELGVISSDHFMPVAEDTGLIVKLGEWALRRACLQMAVWRREDHGPGRAGPLRISVNVSAVQLLNPDFAERVLAILGDADLAPCALTLEVTETAMTRNIAEATLQIQLLRAAGVTVALDDFGAGYSSLTSLQQLPVDYVKIDRCFSERMRNADGGLAVIEAMIGMIRQCGFEVVAEAAEPMGQCAEPKAAGIGFAQNFLPGMLLLADRTQSLPDPNNVVVPR